MSWWVYLGKKKSVKVNPHREGGPYLIGGMATAELNITYNYSLLYHRYIDKKEGLKWLHNKTAKETIHRLSMAVDELGTKRDEDYWAITRGNAGYALSILLEWATKHRLAKWVIH